ncbi:10901_t:CDS:2 [Ambispora leptoticha]|uniref:10901_t:CDS:1 n=1 Tax=Ambispora leptoticha TaxID=144679 RepID=A0A9N9FCB9_9GLOM|nr:10901_t:CDS:2 [Ambispora leptoticha]
MNKYPALAATKKEPEYQVNPPLKISSVGTEIKKNNSSMPFGSAVLTNTGNSSKLKDNGITHIIHATLMSQGSDEGLFIEKAVLAMQNSIILADLQGFDKLATCFLAGGIYCNSESTKPHLADALIGGALSQLEKCQSLKEVIFVDFDADYLKDARDKIAGEVNCPTNINQTRTEKGDKNQNLLHKSLHGTSGELGTEASNVDKQRKDLMKEFNDIINGKRQGDNNNQEKISFLFRYAGRGGSISRQGSHYSMFFSADATPENGGKGKYTIEISENHPIFSEENKELFEKGDFIEIEEQRPQKDNGNDNGDQTSNQNNDNQNQPAKNDNDQSPNEQNGDEDQKPSNSNGSNGNNSNRNKNKNSSNPNIPNSVKEYFRKNKDLKGYLQSRGINSISEAELNITDNITSKNNNETKNETKYWP